HLPAEQGLHLGDAFHQAAAVRAPATEVVDLAGTRVLGEGPQRLNDVVAVDLIAHLLPFVAEDRVRLAGLGDLDQIVEEAVQLDARMARASEAATAKEAGAQAEEPGAFLPHA